MTIPYGIAATVYGLGYRASEPRPARPCVSCHDDGTFSYQDERLDRWVPNSPSVPQAVLDHLPDDERNRVMRHMTAAGSIPT